MRRAASCCCSWYCRARNWSTGPPLGKGGQPLVSPPRVGVGTGTAAERAPSIIATVAVAEEGPEKEPEPPPIPVKEDEREDGDGGSPPATISAVIPVDTRPPSLLRVGAPLLPYPWELGGPSCKAQHGNKCELSVIEKL